MKKTIDKINLVLADWNPIGVPKDIALEEYRDYAQTILAVLQKKENLMNVLEDMLINKMGLEYDPKKKEHVEDLCGVCQKLLLCGK